MKQLMLAEKDLKKEKTKNNTEDAILTLERQLESLKDSSEPEDPKAKVTRKKQINDLEGRILTLKETTESSLRVIARVSDRIQLATKEANTNDLFHQYVLPGNRPSAPTQRGDSHAKMKQRYEQIIKDLDARIATRVPNQQNLQALRKSAQEALKRLK